MKRLDIGAPLVREVRQFPDIILGEDEIMTEKAPDNGVYELNGRRFRARQGVPMPEGAKFDRKSVQTEQRAQEAAPQNKAQQATPENKSTKDEK